jgi:hypothetical protein
MTAADMYEAIAAALRELRTPRFYPDLSATVAPPAVILGPPEQTWVGYGDAPREATFTVALVVAADSRAVPALLDLLPSVTAALLDVPDCVLVRAAPGTWPVGDLPAYLIEIEASL